MTDGTIRWAGPDGMRQPCATHPGERATGTVDGAPLCTPCIAAIAADEADALLRQRSRMPRPRSDGALEGAP